VLTLACSLILSRLDYCNAVLHGAPTSSMQKLLRVQNSVTRVVLQSVRRSPSQPLLQQLHWLPVRQWIDYKLAVLMYKIHLTSTPVYLNCHIQPRTITRQLCSSLFCNTMSLQTDCQNQVRRPCFSLLSSAPAVSNSVTADIVYSSSVLSTLCPPAPLKSLTLALYTLDYYYGRPM